jgi:membrane fusion protein, multidrug efflux system
MLDPDSRPRGAAVTIASLFLATLAGCGHGTQESAAPAKRGGRPVPVVTETAGTRALTYSIRSVGTLEAYEVVTVPARVAGTVEALSFEEGHEVTREKVLARIDPERFRLELAQAEAAVAKTAAAGPRARAQIASAEASLQEARDTLARRQALSLDRAVAREELEAARTAVARWTASLDEARATTSEVDAQVADAKASLALAQKNLADSDVHSPIAGVVEKKHVSRGQYVQIGSPLATLVDTRTLRVRFPVTSAESVRLLRGTKLSFRTPAVPEKTFTAEVLHVAGTADPRTRMVEVLGEVTEKNADLRPGFFANVDVVIGSRKDAVVVPETAVLATEQGTVAYVVQEGVARVRRVVLGLRTPEGDLEIVSGIVPGDRVVVRGAPALQDGSLVAEQAAASAPAAAAVPVAPAEPSR